MIEQQLELPTETAHCSTHGEYQRRTIPGLFGGAPIPIGSCPECRSLSLVSDSSPRDSEREDRIARLLSRSRIPQEYRNTTLDTFPVKLAAQRQVVDNCRTWLDRFTDLSATARRGSWLVLLGPVGSGKTGLACALMHALIRRMYACQYHTITSVRRWCWDAKHRGSNESDAVEQLSNVDVLVIDELGASTASDAETALFGEIIANRCSGRKPTILISNLSREQLGDRLDERAVDRIAQRAAWISCDWPSLRTKRDRKALQVVR